MNSREKLSPITDRPSETLARKHGFESLASLANNLPPNAQVLDVGAGLSPFMADLANLRPDSQFFTADITDYPERLGGEFENLHHIQCSSDELLNFLPEKTFDAIYSYRLFHHLSLQQAYDSLRTIHRLTKPEGSVSVGPKFGFLQQLKSGEALRSVKTDNKSDSEFAKEVLPQVILNNVFSRSLQGAINTTIPEFSQAFIRKDSHNKLNEVWSRERDEYVKILSLSGAQAMSAFALKILQQIPKEMGPENFKLSVEAALGGAALGVVAGAETGSWSGALLGAILGSGASVSLLGKYDSIAFEQFRIRSQIDFDKPLVK